MRARSMALAAGLFALPLMGASFTAHREVAAGNQALQAHDPAGAASHYQAALKDRPDDPVVRYDLGTAHLAAGDLDRAVDDLSHAAAGAEGPLKARADYNLGNALMARGTKQGPAGKADLEGAVNAYRRAVAADPEDADARRNLQLAATRLAALKPPPPQPSGGGRQKPQPNGQKGDSKDSGQSAQGNGASKPGKPQQGEQPGAQGKQDGKQDGQPSAARAGKDDGADRKGQSPGTPDETAGKDGEDGQNGAPTAGHHGDATGDPAGDATAQGGKPLPDEVARVLSGLKRQEAATLREALRRSLGPPKPEDKDW